MKKLDINKLIGQRYGRLEIIGEGINGKMYQVRKGYWHKRRTMFCKCDCGKEYETDLQSLRDGRTRSCGCLNDEKRKTSNRTHGMTRTRIYMIRQGMKDRCNRKSNCKYKDYGGRGIKVCDSWLESFENFYNDMKEGYSDKLELDRIDNDGNYCKENCRWATRKEQTNNTRRNVYVTYKGETNTITQWSEKLGINIGQIRRRLNNRDPLEYVFKK